MACGESWGEDLECEGCVAYLLKYANYARIVCDQCERFGENMQTTQASFAVEVLGHTFIHSNR